MRKELPTFFIKPAPGRRLVRDPITLKPLADGGEVKPQSTYWLRRLRMKEIVVLATQAGEGAEVVRVVENQPVPAPLQKVTKKHSSKDEDRS